MSVNVGAEVYAFFLDLAQICKGEYLETAGVCKDRLIPVHKLMQSAILLDQLVAGTHMKVVGIGKLYLGADLAQVIGRYSAFNSAYSSYIHENRCLDGSMHRCHFGTLRASIFFQ